MKLTHYIYIALTACTLASCAAQKSATQGKDTAATAQKGTDTQNAFLTSVYENEAYQRNIVAKMTFSLNKGQGNVSVPGQLRMRRDQVIRLQLQLPLLGSEVGRLEFTPSEVLLVDRIHKQYCRASYDDVSFLTDNGITFYTLQALFWNKLSLPGEQSIGYGNLSRFTVGKSSAAKAQTPISVESGKLHFQWWADNATARIHEADVTYQSGSGSASSLKWAYDQFQSFGSKQFPFSHTLTVRTAIGGSQKTLSVKFALESISADDSWETTTTLSDRYTEVSVEELLSKLITL